MADKGAIVEFDFTALDGAAILFDTASRFLRELDDIPLDMQTEARHLAGRDEQDGLQRLFSAVRTKKTAAKAARDLTDAFAASLTARIGAGGVSPGFRDFVKALVAKGVRVVIATRADISSDAVRAAFGDLLDERVSLFQDTAAVYGSATWRSWRMACSQARLRNTSCLAVTGSGFGVKAALLAGMGALAVMTDHVAYQDFGGADEVVSVLDASAAKKALSILRL